MKAYECGNDRIMQEDVEQLVCQFPYIEELKNKSILITGATGLIGVQLVRTFACMNRIHGANIRIYALVRNREKAEKLFFELIRRGDVHLCIGSVEDALFLEAEVDYIIHGASATSSRYFVTNPVDTIVTAIDGTRNILSFAAQKQVKAMVYLSSLEVYGTPAAGDRSIGESDYGYIDPLAVRSSYSEGKRMVECLCASYASQYGVPVKVARLSQTFGPGVAYNDGRVFAEFLRCAIEKRNIVLHTQGHTTRTYCYLKDAVSAILYILLKGEAAQAYNVTNMETAISIRDMAQLVCDTIGEKKIQVEFDMPADISAFGYNPEMKICLDSGKLMELGWQPTVGLAEMFRRMKESLKEEAK